MKYPSKKKLVRLHSDGEERTLHGAVGGDILRAVVYGANDGIVTTFAIVAGVAGAKLSADVVLILGVANIVADGISMGMGDFLGSISEEKFKQRQLRMEKWEYEQIPEIEKQELIEMYQEKGYSKKDSEQLVSIHSKNPEHAVELGFQSELGEMPEKKEQVWRTGVATFIAFIIAGSLPLLPYFLAAAKVPIAVSQQFPISIMATVIALFSIGSLRTRLTGGSWWRNGLEMLLIGSVAAGAAYIFGVLVERYVV